MKRSYASSGAEIIYEKPPAVTYAGPPADRMAGRPSVARAQAARAARASAPAPQSQPQPQRIVSDAQNRVDWQREPPTQGATTARAAATENAGSLIARAVHAGVIGANMAAHYTALYNADPQGTRDYLIALGLSPEAPMSTALASADYPTSGLSRAEREHIAGAQAGEQKRFIVGGL